MQNYYRINVSKNGRYLFATEQGGLTWEGDAKKVTELLKEKFPKSEGYEVSVTYWDCRGKILEW